MLDSKQESSTAGKVWLVGAGSGDPDLLTVKAARLIESADLILYDDLVSEQIRAMFPRGVASFYVGKRKGAHSIAQQELNKLLVRRAKSGAQIIRLKGGDPFIFGRGGEELLALRAEGIEVEVVPGITAAVASSATSQIPLTHRGLSQACTFVTAHAETELGFDWRALASLNQTIVFYMGLSRAQDIQNNLLASGMDTSMPVAIVEKASRPDQINYYCTLDQLCNKVADNDIQGPALIMVGHVVGLAKQENPEVLQQLIAVNQCA